MSLLLTRRGVLTGAGTLLAARPLRAATPRRIVIAMPNSPGTATLEPSRDYGNVSFRMGYNLYDTLIGIDYRDGAKLVPGRPRAGSASRPPRWRSRCARACCSMTAAR
ncbi:hypothetical protein [Teichococcus aestuarii]|uniref:hypothetical protein n=1 Tax=Teichococcus aestuarii TaxID=568898 RepID=UPI0036211B06